MKLGLVVLRTVLGALFIGHGTQKLFGWFQGQGLRDTGNWFESLELRPSLPAIAKSSPHLIARIPHP